ncbi:NUDIX hydrolase [Polaromonas sp. P5_D5]
MRRRLSSRLLVLNRAKSLLLFRFAHKTGALKGKDYWATPGGGLEPGETFAEAAVRELKEETGIFVADVGDSISQREFILRLADGEEVIADERFFVVTVEDHQTVLRDHWTAEEVEVIKEHKWWNALELRLTSDIVWPDDIPEMLTSTGWW